MSGAIYLRRLPLGGGAGAQQVQGRGVVGRVEESRDVYEVRCGRLVVEQV